MLKKGFIVLRVFVIDFNRIDSASMSITEDGLKNSSAKWIPSNTVVVAMYGATVGKVGYITVPMTTNQACCNLEVDSRKANYKYVFYWLSSKYQFIKSLGQGSQTNINSKIIKDINIPVPHMNIQNKIVDVLDNFDLICRDLNIGLPAEIEARQKQYEYYRDSLFKYLETRNVDFVEREREREREREESLYKLIQYIWGFVSIDLGELCNIATGKLNANAMVENGKYPFYTCDEKPYRIDEYAFDTSAIIISGNGSQVGHLNLYEGKFNAYQRTYVLDKFRYIRMKYLYYFMKAYLKEYILVNCKKGSVPYITLPMLQNFKVKIPMTCVQDKIITIMDKYDSICNDLESGLPAEIEARKKQYEYYRDKLLSFEERDE